MLFSYLDKEGNSKVVFNELDMFREIEDKIGTSFLLGIEEIFTNLKEASSELSTLQRTIEELQEENSFLESDKETLETNNDGLTDEVKSLRDSLLEKEREIQELQQQLSGW